MPGGVVGAKARRHGHSRGADHVSPPGAARFDEWLEARPDAWRRIVLPPDLKREVRDRLDQVNISERVLMPGLDGLSRWLARYYRES